MSITTTLLTVLVFLINLNIAFAKPYIGATLARSDFAKSIYGYKNQAPASKFFGGYRWKDFGIEIARINFGKYPRNDFDPAFPNFRGKMTFTGFEISGVGYIPLYDKFDLFAKAGLLSWEVLETTSVSNNVSYSTLYKGNEFTYGFGTEYKTLPNFTLRGEVQFFTKIERYKVNLISIGASYRFK